MKIYEIISENNINEGPGLLSKVFGKPVSKMAAGVRKLTTKSPEELQFARDIATIKSGLRGFNAGAENVLKLLSTIGLAGAGLAYPAYTYYTNMTAAEENLKAGKWDQARYDEERRIQLGLLTASLVTGLTGVATAIGITKLLKIIKYLPIVGKPVAAIIGGVSSVAQVAFLYELNTVEGRTILANLFTVGLIEHAGEIIGVQIDRLKELANKAEQNAKNDEQPNQQAKLDKPEKTTTTPDSDTAPEKNTIPKLTPQQSQKQPSTTSGDFVGSKFVRDPNGELRLAVDQD